MKHVKRHLRSTITERRFDFRQKIVDHSGMIPKTVGDTSINKDEIVDTIAVMESHLGWMRVKSFRNGGTV